MNHELAIETLLSARKRHLQIASELVHLAKRYKKQSDNKFSQEAIDLVIDSKRKASNILATVNLLRSQPERHCSCCKNTGYISHDDGYTLPTRCPFC